MSKIPRWAFACFILSACAGCSLPPVTLSTPQPIKVNIAMKLDVYQHAQATPEKKAVVTDPGTPEAIQDRRELQPLKNSRLIGENRLGLLEVRNPTPGEYGDYVQETVAAENKDRAALMDIMAKTQKISLADVEKQQAANAQHSAFNGEWIESQKPDGTYAWTQKGKE
jgi:preprotein translocase subunit SecD